MNVKQAITPSNLLAPPKCQGCPRRCLLPVRHDALSMATASESKERETLTRMNWPQATQTARRASLAGAALLLAAGMGGAAFAQTAGAERGGLSLLYDHEETVLSEAQGGLHSPQAASAGPLTAVTWVERDGSGRDRVRASILHDGQALGGWETYLSGTVDAENGGNGAHPAVAVAPGGGEVLVTWVETGREENRLWASRNWADPELVYTSPGLLEFPGVAFDSEGEPYLTWSEVLGGRSFVHAAVTTEDEEWETFPLSVSERPYDVLPQIFGNEVGAEVYWFSIEANDFTSRVSFIGRTGVVETTTQEFVDIPANRLPILYRVTEEQLLGAYWLDQYEGGELYLDLDPRVVDGPQPAVLGNIEQNPEQATVSADNHASKAWVESPGADGGKLLLVEIPWGGLVELPVGGSVREPVIAVSGEWVHLAWIERAGEDATLRLHYARLR